MATELLAEIQKYACYAVMHVFRRKVYDVLLSSWQRRTQDFLKGGYMNQYSRWSAEKIENSALYSPKQPSSFIGTHTAYNSWLG